MKSIETKLNITLIVLLAGFIVKAVINMQRNPDYIESNHWVTHTQEVITETNVTLSTAKDIGIDRSYIATADKELQERSVAAQAAVYDHISTLRKLVIDNTEQLREIDS